MGTLFLTKEARIYNGEKRASLINGAWKTGQLHVKELKRQPYKQGEKTILRMGENNSK